MNQLVYNAEDASTLLGISKSTLFRLTELKKLKKIRISKRRIGWAHSELIRFINESQCS